VTYMEYMFNGAESFNTENAPWYHNSDSDNSEDEN